MAEKKVEMTDISVEQKLKALYDLQSIMSQIDKIKILRGELPSEVQDLEDEIEGLNTRINNYAEEIKEVKAEIIANNEQINAASTLIAQFTWQEGTVYQLTFRLR